MAVGTRRGLRSEVDRFDGSGGGRERIAPGEGLVTTVCRQDDGVAYPVAVEVGARVVESDVITSETTNSIVGTGRTPVIGTTVVALDDHGEYYRRQRQYDYDTDGQAVVVDADLAEWLTHLAEGVCARSRVLSLFHGDRTAYLVICLAPREEIFRGTDVGEAALDEIEPDEPDHQEEPL